MSVAERASNDRTWAYGHVVVDEAQEVSPMGWRMLLRRCPTHSFTVVGDVAQATASAGTRWWPETMDPLFKDSWNLRELTISYRIPATVAEVAQSFAAAVGLPVSPLTAARDLDNAVAFTEVPEPYVAAARVAAENARKLADTGGGLVAVIAPEDGLGDVRGYLAAAGVGDVEVMSARGAKGLEFDVVVVVEPAQIAIRPGDLYVALTRSTQRLEVIHTGALPPGL